MTKILLVEDDKSLREIYGVRLLAEGYDIVSAGDGEEALAMAIKERPQLIVSDVMMPKISGFDMLDILRSTTETKDIKVIMMTALSSEDQRERGESLGADRYLVKSQVGIEDVVRTVHEVLGDAPVASSAGGNVFAQPAGPRTSVPVAPRAGGGQVNSQPRAPQPPQAPQAPAQQTASPAPATPPSPSQPQSQAPQPPAVPKQPAAPAPPASAKQPAPSPSFSAQTNYLSEKAPGAPARPSESSLPQPTAPFSTDRPAGLGDRIIHPIDQSKGGARDFSNLMAEELQRANSPQDSPAASAQPPQASAQPQAPAAAPQTPPQPKAPPAPAAPAPPASAPQPPAPKPDLKFEETPIPSGASGQQPPK